MLEGWVFSVLGIGVRGFGLRDKGFRVRSLGGSVKGLWA